MIINKLTQFINLGIAATLLEGGRTVHATFKIPLHLNETSEGTCNITKESAIAEIIRRCKIIIWDECTMSHKRALEAINICLQDIRGNNKIMGGIILVLSGDFRQTLPVIRKGTYVDELKACLKNSNIWRHVKTLHLEKNMRAQLSGCEESSWFAEQLLKLGENKIPVNSDTELINIPKNFCIITESVEELISCVFSDIEHQYKNQKWLCERAILCPRNVEVDHFNLEIQNLIPENEVKYYSIDKVLEEEKVVEYPVEFLNSIELSGLPSHELKLKVGTPLMLLRNLDPPVLCNGTRVCIKNLLPHVIEAEVMTGCAKGEHVFIPRIPLMSQDLAFTFQRLQFPVRIAFAMTINKAQGQSLNVAGINLSSPCFSHGQLYVACSRVGNPNNLYIYCKEGQTKNIVYEEAIN
jgi:ATP-dependent DNA helicase PIF1